MDIKGIFALQLEEDIIDGIYIYYYYIIYFFYLFLLLEYDYFSPIGWHFIQTNIIQTLPYTLPQYLGDQEYAYKFTIPRYTKYMSILKKEIISSSALEISKRLFYYIYKGMSLGILIQKLSEITAVKMMKKEICLYEDAFTENILDDFYKCILFINF